MSSVARIGIKDNNTITSVSVFFDGHPKALGPQLLKIDKGRAEEILKFGNFRSLTDGEVERPYNKDAFKNNSIEELYSADPQAYFFYIYSDGEWYFSTRNIKQFKLSDWLSSDLAFMADI